jgi:hypothetical protein
MGVEWALAWFSVDNMMHRACHAVASARQLRHSNRDASEVELEIKRTVTPILIELNRWNERKVVVSAYERERIQRNANIPQDATISTFPVDPSTPLPAAHAPPQQDNLVQFLDSEPLYITDTFFANLLNHHRSIQLCVSLVLQPQWGTHNAARFNCAVELCRTHAAMGDGRNFLTTGKLWGLHLVGLTFGGPNFHPVFLFGVGADLQRESQWVIDRLHDIAVKSSFYAAILAANLLKDIWEAKGNCWDASAKAYQESSKRESEGN